LLRGQEVCKISAHKVGILGVSYMDNTQGIKARSLSKNEARLVSHLEFERQTLVTSSEAAEILGAPYRHIKNTLDSLVRKGWLVRVRTGLYELVPAASGGFRAGDWFVSLQGFRTPCYLSFLSAAYILGLSSQRPQLAQVATPKLVRARYAGVEQDVEQVVVGESKFFGFRKMQRDGLEINVAEPAKAVVDCLYHPSKAGGILEVARILAKGVKQASGSKLVDCAIQMNNRALVQRLGYLVDALGLELAKSPRSRLLRYVSQGRRPHAYLGSVRTFGKEGEWNPTWRITDNVGKERLRKELEF